MRTPRTSPPATASEADLLEGTEVEVSGAHGQVAVWQITAGRLGGVDVSGHVVVALTGDDAGVMLLDERLLPEQTLALFDAFRGRLPNPRFCQLPVELEVRGQRLALWVPGHVRLVTEAVPSSAAVWVHLPEFSLAWQDEACPVTRREFRWSPSGD